MTELEGLQMQFKMMERENKRLMEWNVRLQTEIRRMRAEAKHTVSPARMLRLMKRNASLEKKVDKLSEQLRVLRSKTKRT